jgi:hypothetical protein
MRRLLVHRSGLLAAMAAAVLVLGSCSDTVSTVPVAQVEITPANATVPVGQSRALTARPLASSGEALAGRPVQWRSLHPEIAGVDASGNVSGIAEGTATIEAASGGVTGTTSVLVTSGPVIALGATSLGFTAAAGGPAPSSQSVAVTNAGGGSLTGLTTSIAYTAGQTGWLAATLSGTTAPTSIMVQAATASLAAGTYTAAVSVAAAGAQNTPQQFGVTLTVGAAPPAIQLSSTSLTFAGPQHGASPPPQTLQVTNGGGGSLTGLGVSVTFPGGQPSGWLSAALSATTAPATITLNAVPGALAPGSYSATVNVTSPVAGNSPRQIGVTLTVQQPAPSIVVNPSSATFTTAAAAGNPAPISLAVTNGGGGTLSGLSAAVLYPAGGATGWLSAQLAGTTAPTSLTLTAQRGALPVGTHTATVRLTSAQGAQLDVPVTWSIAAAAPAAPSGVSANAVSHQRIDVRWTDQSGDEDRFEVGRSTDGGGTWPITFNAPPSSELLTDDGLAASTSYTYRVRACNAIGCSAWSAQVSATTAPLPPSNVAAAAVSAMRIDVTWTSAGAGATGNVLERSQDGSTWATRATLAASATAFSDVEVAPGSSYHYRLRACRNGVCSGPSASAQATTPAIPAAPGGLSAAAISATQVNLTWSHEGGAAEFRIESRTGTAAFAQVGAVPGGQTSFTHTGVAPDATHHYRVRACSATDCSAYSGEASATTPQLAPGAPGSLQAAATSTTSIGLTWSASSGTLSAYHIERGAAAGGPFDEIATVGPTVTTYNDAGLAQGTTYFYRVRARNETAYSGYSPVASATTSDSAPDVPGNLAVALVTPSQVLVSWSAVAGATHYQVRRSGSSGGWTVVAENVPAGTTELLDTPGTAGTYRYSVRACAGGLCSDWTSPSQNVTVAAP